MALSGARLWRVRSNNGFCGWCRSERIAMSLFQCQHCGCCENTALASQGCDGYAETFFDWAGFEDRKGKKLCSACAPTKYNDGTATEFGAWHGKFPRTFLPIGEFRTNARNGNLQRIVDGDEDFRKYALTQNAELSGGGLPPSA
jgi:hypothetical protein